MQSGEDARTAPEPIAEGHEGIGNIQRLREARKKALLEYFLWGWGELLSREVAERMAEDLERLILDSSELK